ncbi:cell division ATP-binding protein FtsE [Clostridia bacterium]|nr:cell division ATP-binding protein FtsE [Clostridia bacterium]GHU77289.1 cell division ATP-binding protein FtsE [Clostridia bacterium]
MIHAEDAAVTYRNGVHGITGVTIDIDPGEFVFIVGSSGSGKSTFMKTLLKEVELSDGEIYVGGTDLRTIRHRELPYFRRKMGVVFQDFRLLPNKTVYENVAFAMRVTESAGRDIRRYVPAVLSMVGLAKKARAYPHQLSGGEQQRCSLARAIVNKPPLLLADEPTGNLDPDTAWEIMDLLEDINKTGTTVIIATHAKEIVDTMQQRVIALKNGRVIRDIQRGGYYDED